jgi:hypothetical protein
MASELPGASPSDHTGRSHVPHGVPDLERHGHQVLAAHHLRCERKLHGQLSHLVVGEPGRRERWAHVGGQLVVVEGDEGDVLGDAQAALGQSLLGAERQPVVEADQPREPGVGLQDLARAGVAVGGLPISKGAGRNPRRTPMTLSSRTIDAAGSSTESGTGRG